MPPSDPARAALAAVDAALSLDESGRHVEAITSYRYARNLLERATSSPSAPPGSAAHVTLCARTRNVDARLVTLRAAQAAASGRRSAGARELAPRPVVSGHGRARPQTQHHVQHQVQPSSVVNAEPEMVAAIESEIMSTGEVVLWRDVAGCEDVKQSLQELLIRPAQRPDLYTGIRSPARGIMLFGPPGTGKTMAAKAAASECGMGTGKNVTFFSVSSSTFASKWHGDGEKLMRALFEVARSRQPALIFVDEIDSIMGKRGGANEAEASRRLKTEFLTQVDGAGRAADEQVFVLGATNRPQDLDDAVLRRLSKRIFVPLPDAAARTTLLRNLTIDSEKSQGVKWSLTVADIRSVAGRLQLFSGADIHALTREAALMPLREMPTDLISSVDAKKVRGVKKADFENAMAQVKPSVNKAQLVELQAWDREFGLGNSGGGSGGGGPGSGAVVKTGAARAVKAADVVNSMMGRRRNICGLTSNKK